MGSGHYLTNISAASFEDAANYAKKAWESGDLVRIETVAEDFGGADAVAFLDAKRCWSFSVIEIVEEKKKDTTDTKLLSFKKKGK